MSSHGAEGATRRSYPFWIGFTAGWGAYFGINFFFGLANSGDASWALKIAAVNALPFAILAVPVAAARRRLFRPGMAFGRLAALNAAVALAYSLVAAFALVSLTEATGITLDEFGDASFGRKVLFLTVSASFLYIVFGGVLLWSESLRHVQESQRLAAREAVLRAEAESKAVRAQFNPHFVFNTLHSLMLLVRADPDAAERAIEDVATLIRYASIVQRRDLDAVPLAKELEVARRYVALERLRLGSRLEVSWRVEVDAAALTVPAFALQTLVENAIKHGIEPMPGGGRVTVGAAVEAGRLVLRVVDEGAGSDPGAVEGRPGHGLDLLRRRLASRYGDEADMEWSTGPGRGFDVRLRIPAEEPASEPALDVIEGRPEPTGVGADA